MSRCDPILVLVDFSVRCPFVLPWKVNHIENSDMRKVLTPNFHLVTFVAAAAAAPPLRFGFELLFFLLLVF